MRKYGEVKRLELWWQLYRTSFPVWDLENFRPMDVCWHECTTRSPDQTNVLRCARDEVQRQVGGRGIIEATSDRENIKHTTNTGATVTESYEKSPCIEVHTHDHAVLLFANRQEKLHVCHIICPISVPEPPQEFPWRWQRRIVGGICRRAILQSSSDKTARHVGNRL